MPSGKTEKKREGGMRNCRDKIIRVLYMLSEGTVAHCQRTRELITF